MVKIIHSANGTSVEKEVKLADFLLTNKRGGYLYLSTNSNKSRFQGGYFYHYPFQLNKWLESINLVENYNGGNTNSNESHVTEIKNELFQIKRISNKAIETFVMPHDNVLAYQTQNYTGDVIVTFDCRKIYDFDDKGRIYKIIQEKDALVIEYTKFIDDNLKEKSYTIYIALITNGTVNLLSNWVKKEYSFDKERNSLPMSLYVYDALKISCKETTNIFFGYSEKKEEAISKAYQLSKLFDKELHLVQEHTNSIINNHDKNLNKNPNKNNLVNSNNLHLNDFAPSKKLELPAKEYQIAYHCAQVSLDSLTQEAYGDFGIYAGLPWFFQFWARDEAICLGALISENKINEAKSIINRHLRHITEDGRIPNMYPRSNLASADGLGLVFMQIDNLIQKLQSNKTLHHFFSKDELEHIHEKLQYAIKRLIEKHEDKGLITNNALETWMDTDFADDNRTGKRVEIQCLFLRMLLFAKKLSEILDNSENKKFYAYLEETFAERVRALFLENGKLCDGLNDPTQRPNIFISYLAYPNLFKKSVWEQIFSNALSKTWLEWGGISTIEKNSPLYIDIYTGENNRSYHRGDSWFFINNLAAIAMHKLNKRKFSKEILKILNSSTSEILYMGIIGYCAEVSSASNLKSEGCQAQAWSSSTYIELCNEIGKRI